MKKHFFFSIIIVLLSLTGCENSGHLGDLKLPNSKNLTTSQSSTLIEQDLIFPPLPNANSRITKKNFGIAITPKTSPVQPERFNGYHTGVDFETLPAEQTIDIAFYSICSGPLILKKWATGYGGVIVQQCDLANQAVTVVYGHIRLDSIKFGIGTSIPAGTQLGVLGTGFTAETDIERKHLHLAIHKGSGVNILGYVQNQADLSNWLNLEQYLPLD